MTRLLVLALALLAALPLLGAGAALPETSAATRGAAYIKSLQTPDGAYGSTSPGQNMDAIFAVRAAGFDPAKDLTGGKSPADYLRANAAAATSPAAAAKAALGAKALGLDPKAVSGTNLIANISVGLDAATGKYAADDFSQSIAMLGLACTGNPVAASATTALKATQIANGGWGFSGASDPDTAAIAIQALLAAGVPKTDAALVKALAYLKAAQADDGGWGYDTTASNVSSTAFAIQALLALGENPEGTAYVKAGVSPVAYLLSQQNADGSFKGFDPAFGTNQVVPALAGRTFCNAAETAITQVRPVVTATPSPTVTVNPATPTPATTTAVPTTATTAPLPPATGNTPGPGGSSTTTLALLATIILTIGAAGLATTRRAAK